ncbi:tRNA lysidine(34) synthetase TilS, partial [Mixta calida]
MTQLAQLEQRLAGERRLLVAFSGGLDSTVLLHQLTLLRQHQDLQLRAIHIHHGLSPHADRWAQHCRTVCDAWQVALETVKIAVNGSEGGIEASAREGRYRAFRQHLQAGEALVTAQHLDDQCETLLLALKRGSGPAGLAAMPASLTLGGHRLL